MRALAVAFFACLSVAARAEQPVDPLPSPPSHLRPCCAFGTHLQVAIGALPVPLVSIGNVAAGDDLGRHTYDGGLVARKHGLRSGYLSREHNGLAYTCRAGFLDVAHVRDYADWTFFLAHWVARGLDTGSVIRLSDEGGWRFIYLTAIDEGLGEQMGRWELSVALAQWLAFQLSLWHETATWYGWAALGLFPEYASAFSPEDLYSNLLGAKLAGFALLRGEGDSEGRFNDAMDGSIAELLANAVVLPREVTEHAARSIDGVWWDSNARLPEKDLVLRRYLDLGPELAPWLVPPKHYTEALRQDLASHCAGLEERPIPLRLTTEIEGVGLASLARFDVFADEAVAARFPRSSGGSRWVGQHDFPVLVEAIRREVRAERGPDGDRP